MFALRISASTAKQTEATFLKYFCLNRSNGRANKKAVGLSHNQAYDSRKIELKSDRLIVAAKVNAMR